MRLIEVERRWKRWLRGQDDETLATASGTSVSAVYKWKKEGSLPCAESLWRLRSKMGLDLNELVDGPPNGRATK